jgi:hypothetical protein
MFDAIIGILVTVGAGAFAIWGARWKFRAERSKQQIDDYQRSSDLWHMNAAKRVEEIKRQAAEKKPIDPKERKDFE